MPLSTFQHLLPNARAWRLTAEKQLREFFEGLTGIEADAKVFVDEVWLDIFPETTRELTAWEAQWGLADTVLTEQQRRDRLDATWKSLGGQSPRYIQDTLRDAGFDVYVHEWWEPLLFHYFAECGELLAECGELLAECGELVSTSAATEPEVRDPNDVLSNAPSLFIMCCGGVQAICGGVQAICGAAASAPGFLLVNKPANIVYDIPLLEADWSYILYIGGLEFGDTAQVQLARRDEFEALCLKICPAQQWLGLIVEFN